MHPSRFDRLGFLTGGLFLALALHLGAAEPGWKLVWADEFETPGRPDPRTWVYESGFVRNHEAQLYTVDRRENARVENGLLVIEARKEHVANPRYGSAGAAKARADDRTRESAEYTSASLTTEGKAEWKYGRIEVRARLPKGRGIWPAIWMLGSNHRTAGWPACGEIDIMEFVGFMPNTIHGNLHMAARDRRATTGAGAKAKIALPNTSGKIDLPEPPDTAFHVYAIEWDAEKIGVFLDDHAYLTYRNPHTGPDAWPFDQPFYLLLNIAVGGAWGGQKGIDDGIFPQRMEVDYVRVYQHAS